MNNIESLSRQSDAKIKVYLPGGKREVTIGINIRPYWEEALNRIKDKYHIVAFTASHESYADPVLNYLDPNKKIFEYRLYRAHCVLCVIDEMKFYIKDLKILEDNYDLKNIVIIDNSVLSFAYHLDNGIPISPFYDSKSDTELLDIADFLVKYADENDIRDKLKEVYKLNEYLEILKYYSSTEENKEFSDLSGIDDINNKNKIEKKNMNISKPTDKLNQPLKENNTDNDNKVNKKQINIKRSNKNASKINIKLKEIYNMFDDKEIKEKNDKKNYSPKIKEHLTINQYMNKHLAKQNEMQVYNRFRKRSYRKTLILDINFKKQWEEKQKELKNKK
jgi:Dullard-like phosphatase family protein